MADPNLPIPSYPQLEPTSALNFTALVTEVAYKIGCAYYGADGTAAPSAPIDTHDLTLCQNIVNKAIRKFLNDGPKPSGWRFLNPIAQVDLWPQISYDPTGSTFVSMLYVAPSGNVGAHTILTLHTPPISPQTGDIDTSYVPSFLQSMEYRQIYLNGNPPSTTPGWYQPVDEDFTGTLIGTPYTIVQYLSPTQIIVDGNATVPGLTVTPSLIAESGVVSGGTFSLTVNRVGTAPQTASGIAWNASASTIQSALTGLSNVGAGNVTVTQTVFSPFPPQWTVSFSPTLGYVYMSGVSSLSGTTLTAPFSFACTGDYTLPANFGGEYIGGITYVANTNRGMILHWTSEFSIRERRQNYNVESGTPYEAAVRLMPTPSYAGLTNTSGLVLPRRRWELMTWRISSEFLSVLFKYTLAFNSLVNSTDVPPIPFTHDEALKACCLAVAEKEVEDSMGGPDWDYYHNIALPQSYAVDARSVAKNLGYFGNPAATRSSVAQAFKGWRADWYQRPTVGVNPLS